jgi:hypothetical protein
MQHRVAAALHVKSGASVPEETNKTRWTLKRIVLLAVVIFALLTLAPLILGVIIALADGERAATIIGYARDLLTIALLLTAITVVSAVALLIVQTAVMVGVIRLDLGAVFGELRGAFSAVSGAARFIGEVVAAPAIRVLSFFSGAFAFLRELRLLRRALRRNSPKK